MQSGQHVLVVGAGLAGSLLAVYMARRGHRVSVYERRGDPRRAGYAGGRSINLAMSVRGLTGLAGVGLDEMVMRSEAIAMRGRMMHGVRGPDGVVPPLVFQPYSPNPADAIYSVSRGGLNLALINAAASEPNVTLHFDHPCTDADPDVPWASFVRPSGEPVKVTADVIIGTDGAFSAIRGRLMKTDRFEYSQTYLQHGYKELHIPAAKAVGVDPDKFDGYALDPSALHIWPRGGAMMIALPNRDKSFTCTLFWPLRDDSDDGHGLTNPRSDAEVMSLFERFYPDAVPLMPTLLADYKANPNGSLATIRCWPWQHGGKMALLGDAAHAIVPFYGQGMNASFEDCLILNQCLDQTKVGGVDQFAAALAIYQEERKPNADAIAQMALDNFIEMRDKVGSPDFLYKKKVEQLLAKHLPDSCKSQYNLVSFSNTPYADALRLGQKMDAVCAKVIERLPRARGLSLPPDQFEREALTLAKATLAAGSPGALAAAPAATASPNTTAWIDITPPVTDRTQVFPGDTPYQRKLLMETAKGQHITLSALTTSLHLGAHADGPMHYGYPASGVGEMPLEHFIGLARVVHARPGCRGRRVGTDDLGGAATIAEVGSRGERIVLIATGTFDGYEAWNSDFAGLEVELVRALAAQGVVTIGVDCPSVDTQDSKDLPAHKAIFQANIAILEGLALGGVAAGVYELFAPPLRLIGADASPVRALLRPLPRRSSLL